MAVRRTVRKAGRLESEEVLTMRMFRNFVLALAAFTFLAGAVVPAHAAAARHHKKHHHHK